MQLREYVRLTRLGHSVELLPSLNGALAKSILRFISSAPHSVSHATLMEQFGQGTEEILQEYRRSWLKLWDQGYYVKARYRDEVQLFIAQG